MRDLRIAFAGPAAALVLGAAAPRALAADAARAARAEAMKATLANIDAELKRYGDGSWQTWGAKFRTYREETQKIVQTLKWPWPAKKNFVFQGAAIRLLCHDTLDDLPDGRRPYDAVAAFDKQLKARGVDLIFVPLPDKLAIYPDYLSETCPKGVPVCMQVKHLMSRLLRADVEVVDLYTFFLDWQAKHPDKPLYYDGDSHWRNRAAQLAGEKIAERLRRCDFVQKTLAEGNRYSTKPDLRKGDRPDEILVVFDAKTGGRYADDRKSPILITGDSNLMMNMGGAAAHMPAQVARHVGMPLAFVAPTFGDAPAKIRNQLPGKRVVIWAQIGRSLTGNWPLVDLGDAKK